MCWPKNRFRVNRNYGESGFEQHKEETVQSGTRQKQSWTSENEVKVERKRHKESGEGNKKERNRDNIDESYKQVQAGTGGRCFKATFYLEEIEISTKLINWKKIVLMREPNL